MFVFSTTLELSPEWKNYVYVCVYDFTFSVPSAIIMFASRGLDANVYTKEEWL